MTLFIGKYRKFALALSAFAIIVWLLLGAGTSLAWFVSTDEEVQNIFYFAEFDLEVSYRLPDGSWEKIEGATEIFDQTARYEPGYTQIVYLKVENLGEVPFNFETAVGVTDFTIATNVYGQRFYLQDYLRFGLAVADTETAMEEAVHTREQASQIATRRLSNYSTEAASLDAKGTKYIALVVRMPEEVDNQANYRGELTPKVELGIIVRATQKTN